MHKRIDKNQGEIVKALRKMGCSVWITSEHGKGAPDLAVGIDRKNYFFELKDGSKCLSAQELTPCEKKFHDEWKGQICIINSIEAAVAFVNTVRYL